jgi:hypothetical protein
MNFSYATVEAVVTRELHKLFYFRRSERTNFDDERFLLLPH